MISVICPTRGRPALFKQMMTSLRATAVTTLEVIVGIGADGDDVGNNNYGYDTNMCKVIKTGLLPGVQCSIEMANMAHGDVIVCMPDDCLFIDKGWDKALQEAYDKLDNKIHVFTLRDSRDEALHIGITREFVKAMGYYWPPIFFHWYVDPWVIKLAKECNCHTHLEEYSVQHLKPTMGDRPKDETFTRIREMGWHRRDTFVNNNCQHFYDADVRKLRTALHLEVCSI